jgi:AcrR family transcriptional regulator
VGGDSSGRQETPRRILDAAARRIAADGASALALNTVAREAGVSKALIHYHFRDKDTLLARLVDHIAEEVVARERASLAPFATRHSPLAVDALWQWLDDELRRGSIRVLLELGAYPGPSVRAAVQRAAERRRAAAEGTLERLFSILELRSRVPVSLLANVVVAFTDGLALDAQLERGDGDESSRGRAPRVAFDVFWLAMLSLAE